MFFYNSLAFPIKRLIKAVGGTWFRHFPSEKSFPLDNYLKIPCNIGFLASRQLISHKILQAAHAAIGVLLGFQLSGSKP